jgi:hypothetical protein
MTIQAIRLGLRHGGIEVGDETFDSVPKLVL